MAAGISKGFVTQQKSVLGCRGWTLVCVAQREALKKHLTGELPLQTNLKHASYVLNTRKTDKINPWFALPDCSLVGGNTSPKCLKLHENASIIASKE